jgi:dextranase
MATPERESARVVIRGLVPERTWVPPGSRAFVVATIESDRRTTAEVSLELLDLDRVVARTSARRRLPAGHSILRLGVTLPDLPRHGYGLRLRIRSGRISRAAATTAVEALEGWWESPRHVALIDHTEAGTRAVEGLRRWHVSIAQAYDWMWRHYRYEPPDRRDPFRDTLGRRVSHRALRATIRTAARAGIGTLAYGSVYGAESEHVAVHPDDRVFNPHGRPLSLGGTFFINDLRPGSAWRRRLLGQYRQAMRRFGFAGIHMDTYGPPYTGVGADGEALVFAELYPGLIREAAGVVGAVRHGRVLFNCVEGFPLEAVAPAPMAALYLELWPPDDRLHHVVAWIDRAHGVADRRPVVIAAYAAAMRTASGPVERSRAMEASLLLTSVIAAAGAYHHTLAEGDRLLVEGYYPAAVRLQRREAAALRDAWRFTARHLHLLTDVTPDTGLARTLRLRDASGRAVPTSDAPAAGSVWVRATRARDGRPIVHLIDLRAQADDRWDAGREPSPLVSGWQVSGASLEDPVVASPWTAHGDALIAVPTTDGWRLPRWRRWTMLVGSTTGTSRDASPADAA